MKKSFSDHRIAPVLALSGCLLAVVLLPAASTAAPTVNVRVEGRRRNAAAADHGDADGARAGQRLAANTVAGDERPGASPATGIWSGPWGGFTETILGRTTVLRRRIEHLGGVGERQGGGRDLQRHAAPKATKC